MTNVKTLGHKGAYMTVHRLPLVVYIEACTGRSTLT